jgi:hypothetical protein
MKSLFITGGSGLFGFKLNYPGGDENLIITNHHKNLRKNSILLNITDSGVFSKRSSI